MSASHDRDPIPWTEPRLAPADRVFARRSLISGRAQIVLDGHTFRFESLLEYRCAIIAVARPNFAGLRCQVGPVAYRDGTGRIKKHFFDHRITTRDGRRVLVTVKNTSDVERLDFVDELALVRAYTPRTLGDAIVLRTEAHAPAWKVALAEAVVEARAIRAADPVGAGEEDAALDAVLPLLSGEASIADLCRMAALPAGDAYAVLRALGDGRLVSRTPGWRSPASIVARGDAEAAAR